MGRNISVCYARVSLYIGALNLSCDFESAGVVCFHFMKNKTNQNYLSPDEGFTLLSDLQENLKSSSTGIPSVI